VRKGGEPFEVQQAAANLTYLKDRPISIALSGLSQALNARAQQDSATVHAGVDQTLPIVTGVVLVALVLGLLIGIYALLQDNAERLRAEAALEHQARHDSLTGLPNRLLFLQRLAEVFDPSSGVPKEAAILMLDLNRFKEVNDTLGHQFGDVLLQRASERLHDALRPTDTLSRLGGDEFAVLLTGTGAEGAERAAQKLLRALELPFDVAGHRIEIGASIGIVCIPEHGADPATVLRRADVAMYAAKSVGGQYRVYANELDAESPSRLGLASELRGAIDREELRVYFQPRVDMRTGAIAGAEALVRWQHPQRGQVPPDEFIPLAEQTGLIKPLTKLVLHAALDEARRWRATGFRVPVAVNLSMRNLQDRDLVATIDGLLGETDAADGLLDVELTETAVMADIPQSLETLGQLRAMGVTIAIDDFGTGYSSLAYLKRLPVGQIKIDRGFVTDLVRSAEDAAVVKAIIDLGHSLGHTVVAEGVEDQATWDWLAEAGCDEAQGYLICRPVPPPEFARWLRLSTTNDLAQRAA
jgi:diguanylate cyclase (GGDEF)-like protein